MLDIESMIKAKRVVCLKKFLEDYPSSWKTIFDKILSPIGGRFILNCNFDTAKLRIPLPAYYKECLDAWSEINNITPSSPHEVVNEIIWNNRFLCIEKMTMYRSDIVNLGIQKIGDLISANNSFLYNYATPLATAEQRFFLDPIPSIPTIMIGNGNVAPILDVSSKQIYQIFVGLKQISPSAKQKLTDKYSNTIIEWEKVYSLPFCTTLESKIREFQYKILNCIVFTNVKLYRFGLAD